MYRIFSDINCPFCFVQHSRLESLGLLEDERIEWHYVEHAPDFISTSNTQEQLKQLEEEYFIICQRAKDIDIKFPGFCVNTRLAILSLITVTLEFPEKSRQYRKDLYKAYWQESLDISSPAVLSELLSNISIDALIFSEQAEKIQAESQRQWSNGILEKRIPSVLSEKNRVLLGLQHSQNLKAYFQNDDFDSIEIDNICKMQQRQTIAVITNDEKFYKIKQGLTTTNTLHFNSSEELVSNVEEGELHAIIIDSTGIQNKSEISALQNLRHSRHFNRELPIVVLDKNPSSTNEVIAFAYGASDYLPSSISVRSLDVRLKHHIKSYQTQLLLSQHAYIDSLTGLYNKRIFNQKYNEEWQRACRNKTPLSIILIDVDHFKHYNDNYGHCLGDSCLKHVAKVINEQLLRPSDFAARFGGEEFIVVAPATDNKGAQNLATKILSSVYDEKMPHEGSATANVITVSLGVASTFPHPDVPPIKLVEEADKALYQSKNNGRNQLSIKHLPAPLIHTKSS